MLLTEHVLDGVPAPDQVRDAMGHEHLSRVAVAEEQPRRRGRAVGTRAFDREQITRPHPGKCHAPGEHIVGRAQRARDGITVAGEVAVTGDRPHGEVAFDEAAHPHGRHVMIHASVRYNEPFSLGFLDISRLHEIDTAATRQVTTQLHYHLTIRVPPPEIGDGGIDSARDLVDVEIFLIIEIRDTETAADIDGFQREFQLRAQFLCGRQDGTRVLNDSCCVKDSGAHVDVDSGHPHMSQGTQDRSAPQQDFVINSGTAGLCRVRHSGRGVRVPGPLSSSSATSSSRDSHTTAAMPYSTQARSSGSDFPGPTKMTFAGFTPAQRAVASSAREDTSSPVPRDAMTAQMLTFGLALTE